MIEKVTRTRNVWPFSEIFHKISVYN